MLSKARLFRLILSFYPPWVGAAISMNKLTDDFREAQTRMKFRWYNKNAVKTQFGGSLYSMTDPVHMLMIMMNLGDDYIVWDKRASIDFIAPGRSEVFATFTLTDETLKTIRTETAGGRPWLHEFLVEVKDTDGELVAQVNKTVYIRRKEGR